MSDKRRIAKLALWVILFISSWVLKLHWVMFTSLTSPVSKIEETMAATNSSINVNPEQGECGGASRRKEASVTLEGTVPFSPIFLFPGGIIFG
jgi:hypothetical protein